MSSTADDRSFLAESFNMLKLTASSQFWSAVLAMVSRCAVILAPQSTAAHTALVRKGYKEEEVRE